MAGWDAAEPVGVSKRMPPARAKLAAAKKYAVLNFIRTLLPSSVNVSRSSKMLHISAVTACKNLNAGECFGIHNFLFNQPGFPAILRVDGSFSAPADVAWIRRGGNAVPAAGRSRPLV